MTSKCYLDANFLAGLKIESIVYHKIAGDLLSMLNPETYKLYISPLTIDEFLQSIRKMLFAEKVGQKIIWQQIEVALDSVLSLPHLEIINPPTTKIANKKVVNLIREFDLKPRDAYHLLIMQENGINNFVTFDSDFDRVFKTGIIRKLQV